MLDFYLFDTPKIYENYKEVIIPAGKVSGILFYVLMKKTVSRDELAGIFWPDSSDKNAKMSLRNVLYKIRNYFKYDLILTPNNSVLTVNENIDIHIDAEEFEKDPEKNINLYSGDFLNGFFIKDLEDFEHWILEMRMYYRNLYIKNMEKILNKKLLNDNSENLELTANKLLYVDPYNELAYISLMKYFKDIERYDKFSDLYDKYKHLMEEELGVEPSYEVELMKEEVEKLFDLYDENIKSDSELEFFNRDKEQRLIRKNIENFFYNKNYKSVLILGEDGIGKTTLLNESTKVYKNKIKFIKINCEKVEKDIDYSLWMKIFYLTYDYIKDNAEFLKTLEQKGNGFSFLEFLNEFKPAEKEGDSSRELFLFGLYMYKILQLIEKKIVVVVENLEFSDRKSVVMIDNIVNYFDNVMFILTADNTSKSFNKKLKSVLFDGTFEVIELKRFSMTDVYQYVNRNVKREIPERDLQDIYEKSNGNPFFLREYIKIYEKNSSVEGSGDIKNSRIFKKLNEKFLNLSPDERQILNVISAYDTDIPIHFLMDMFKKSYIDTMKAINNLCDKGILQVSNGTNELELHFAFDSYREYFYQTMNVAVRQIIHKKIADTLEENLSANKINVKDYFRLKYHYQLANVKVSELKYSIYILNYYLYFNHEVYPNVSNYNFEDKSNYFVKNDRASDWIKSIEDDIKTLKNSSITSRELKELSTLELMFLIIKGRFLIREGNYKSGIKTIESAIQTAEETYYTDIEVAGHIQMIVCGIQLNDTDLMLKHILKGIEVSKKSGIKEELGVLKRLYGLYYTMIGDFQSAEKLFKEAINIFESSESIEKNNPINIATVYNYLGEIRAAQFKYEEAAQYYNKAIEVCEGVEATGISVYYLNAATICLLTGDIDGMRENCKNAQRLVKQFESYWKSAMLNAFLCFIAFLSDDIDLAIEYLKMANEQANYIQEPRESGMIYFIETLIKLMLNNKKDEKEYMELDNMLNSPAEVYYYKAKKYLDKKRDAAVVDYLEKFYQRNKIDIQISQ